MSEEDIFHHIQCPYLRPGYFTGVIAILGDTITLIDTGLASSPKEAIAPYIQRAGRKVSEISHIVLTHAHGDHFEGIPSILEMTDARVIVHELEQPKVKELATRTHFEPSQIQGVRHGDTLPLSNRELEVFHCPGHSVGSICLIDRDAGVCVSGDSIQGRGEARPLIFYSTIAYLNSMERLLLKPLRTLMMGHPFPPYMQPVVHDLQVREILQASILAVNDLRTKVLRVLQFHRKPLSLQDIVQYLPEVRSPSIKPMLDELWDAGQVRRLGKNDERLWLIR